MASSRSGSASASHPSSRATTPRSSWIRNNHEAINTSRVGSQSNDDAELDRDSPIWSVGSKKRSKFRESPTISPRPRSGKSSTPTTASVRLLAISPRVRAITRTRIEQSTTKVSSISSPATDRQSLSNGIASNNK